MQDIVSRTTGYIDITDPKTKEPRCIFYLYCDINTYENLRYYSSVGLEDMVYSEKTYISLGNSGSSVEIIKKITEHFGGWLDENDCDDKEYYYIEKQDSSEPPLFMTTEELKEHFGRNVIIVDRKI